MTAEDPLGGSGPSLTHGRPARHRAPQADRHALGGGRGLDVDVPDGSHWSRWMLQRRPDPADSVVAGARVPSVPLKRLLGLPRSWRRRPDHRDEPALLRFPVRVPPCSPGPLAVSGLQAPVHDVAPLAPEGLPGVRVRVEDVAVGGRRGVHGEALRCVRGSCRCRDGERPRGSAPAVEGRERTLRVAAAGPGPAAERCLLERHRQRVREVRRRAGVCVAEPGLEVPGLADADRLHGQRRQAEIHA